MPISGKVWRSGKVSPVVSRTRHIVKACDERKDNKVDTLIKLSLLYEEDRKGATSAQVADVVELMRKVTELEKELGEKGLLLQTLLSFDDKKATLPSKVEKMRTATTQLQLETDAVPIVKNDISELHGKAKDVVAEGTALKRLERELEAKLCKNSKHAMAVKMFEDAVKN